MTKRYYKLIEEMSDQDWWSRQKAITDLVKHPEEEYTESLEKALRNHNNANIRNTVIEVYKALGKRAFPYLFLLLKDKDFEIRIFSANILGEIGGKEALLNLLESIKDANENVRIASAEALGKIGNEKALNGLKKALNDETWVAMAALQAIGEIGGKKALCILYDCLDKEEYQGMAITAIGNKGNKQSIGHLTKFIDSPDKVFNRELALEAIVKIADRERFKPEPENFSKLVPVLIDIIKSTDSELKKSAFIALCWSEDIKGLPLFIDAIKDEELLEYAIDGLLSLGKKAAPAITRALKVSSGNHRGILAKVLSMLGENGALIRFKKDENPEVRREVALALGSVNSNTSIRALLKMLSDPLEDVRLAARRSLTALNRSSL